MIFTRTLYRTSFYLMLTLATLTMSVEAHSTIISACFSRSSWPRADFGG